MRHPADNRGLVEAARTGQTPLMVRATGRAVLVSCQTHFITGNVVPERTHGLKADRALAPQDGAAAAGLGCWQARVGGVGDWMVGYGNRCLGR